MIKLPVPLFQKAVSAVLSNAVVYMEKGGNVLVYLDEGCLVVENECTLIKPESLVYLFEPFYLPEFARDNSTGGNGLGLYITATILKLIGLGYSFVPTASSPGMRFVIQLLECGYGLHTLLPPVSPPLFAHIAFSIFLRCLSLIAHRFLCVCISAKKQYDTDISISNGLCFLSTLGRTRGLFMLKQK